MQNNRYVLITGAGEGLGKSLAIEFASRGWNLILVALPGPQLGSLACFIRRNYLTTVITFETDLCEEQNCVAMYEEIHSKGITIKMLINNAGIGNTFHFSEGSVEFFRRQIRLNVWATTLITKLFLKDLCENSPSHIVNIGSLSSFFFLPRKQVYGGTKSFIYSFSKSLQEELCGKAVTVSVVCPGGINTNPYQTYMNRNASWIARQSLLNAETVARIIAEKVLAGKSVIIPGIINRFFLLLDKLIPEIVKRPINNYQMKKLQPGMNVLHLQNEYNYGKTLLVKSA